MNVSNRKERKDFAFFAVTGFLILLYVINFASLSRRRYSAFRNVVFFVRKATTELDFGIRPLPFFSRLR
jgi:hypothetical protein